MILRGMPWLERQLKKLEETNSVFKEDIEKIKEMKSKIFNEFHHWTPLKLTFLNFTLDVCAIVVNKKYEKKNYIDLFAGSGINRTKGKNKDFLIGSPFIALLNHHNKFTKFFFCEERQDFFEALNERVNELKLESCYFFPEDCNLCLDEILEEIKKDEKAYNFFFIDPYSLEFSWESMKKLLNIRSDILITFMDRTCWRTVCTNKVTGYGHKTLNNFFGDGSWKNANSVEELIEIYKKNILKEREDAIILSTQIKSATFPYTLIFITHKTEGGNPWMKPIVETSKEIEKHSEKAVKMAFEIIKKRQTTLDL